MIKLTSRIISGILASIFVGQVLIYGDGACQGILHAETISEISASVDENSKKADLAKEFEEAVSGIGSIDYFGSNDNVSLMSAEEDSEEIEFSSNLTVSGYVQKGTVPGYTATDTTPITVYIFDENWNELSSQSILDGESYEVTTPIGTLANIKIECDGYLPFYLKGFGTGAYTIGSEDSVDTVTLIPGDTTYNYYNENKWSDDVLSSQDKDYVDSCYNAVLGNTDFNMSMDGNNDGIINQEELDAFCEIYMGLAADGGDYDANFSYYDVNNDGVINKHDYQLLKDLIAGTRDNSIVNIPDFNGDEYFIEDDLVSYWNYLFSADVIWYNHDINRDGRVNADDYVPETLNYYASLRAHSDNYYAYMDKNADGIIDNFDISWFSTAFQTYGNLEADMAYKKTLTMYDNGYFAGSLDLHDTNLNLNGYVLNIEDCICHSQQIFLHFGQTVSERLLI